MAPAVGTVMTTGTHGGITATDNGAAVGVVHGNVHLHAAPPQLVPVVPRQLPAAPGLFAGRTTELARLDHVLTRTAAPDGPHARAAGPAPAGRPTGPLVAGATVLVSAIGGAGGIGKTWLALAWAHRNLDQFPDGQLFVDLHGFSAAGDPVKPAAAVRGFLNALGVDPGRIPTDLDAQAALYRSLVAGRRMLIVLDNAATGDQVVPLLPGSPTCTVLVTGRHRLASLIDRHGARHLPLGVLTCGEARALLADRLGHDRVAAAPEAVDELIGLCGGHPLALSITARTADSRHDTPLAEVAAELRELGLEMLDHDTDPAASLPTVLSWSLRRLTEQQRTVFALLGIAPGPDITPSATAALTGLPDGPARRTLAALEDASLLERRPGGRYAMHDLVRAYAATTAPSYLPESVRWAALERAMDFYLHTAYTAHHLVNPYGASIRPEPPTAGVVPQSLPDESAAMAWLEAEHLQLIAAQRTAASYHRHHTAWHFAWNVAVLHQRRAYFHDDLTMWRTALDAAQHLSDPAARIRAHRYLGHAHAALGRFDEASDHLHQALTLATHHDDTLQRAGTHHALASMWAQRGADGKALRHARHALDLYRTCGTPVWVAAALNAVGWFSAHLGDHDTAREYCQEALALHRHLLDPGGEATTLDSLGYIDHRTGRHHQAVHHYQSALTLYRATENLYQVADTLDRIGHPCVTLGQHDQARTAWLEALTLYREQGRSTDAARVQQQLDDLDGVTGVNRDSA
ncbi:ATP-binding protein [Saccharothrix sp. Mg75]|uniref:ATP-binding protein n=1 Tax=Saccharothrix sp. Mg75 TaxID=3445357 RepID=UPI003EEBE249